MKRSIKISLWVGLALLLGILIGRWTSGSSKVETQVATNSETVWTCSMHPQIRQDHPGTCPLCGMDLIPADTDDDSSSLPADALKMSATAMQLANVETAVVGAGDATKEIRLTGKLTTDPRNLFIQTAHFSGRIERFYFGSPGEFITKGAKIADVYSPELIDAQKELLLTYNNKENMPGAFEAVKEKLRLWQISETQINQIIQNGKVEQRLSIFANASGYLTEKQIAAGDYVEIGSPMFTLSQFSTLWAVFNVYEKDAAFVKAGMPVTYTVAAVPGKEFTGKIDFVEPVLNPETRTLNARVVINNQNLELKPEMLVNARVASAVSGKSQLVVPKSAVMWTGKKSVVYVKYSSENDIGFAMRPVVLGASLGDSYVIESGLEPGEEIVVQGTFSVDAAAQLANKPSMMNQPSHTHHEPLTKVDLSESQRKLFEPLYADYFVVKDALVKDDFATAKSANKKLAERWQKTDWKSLPESVRQQVESRGNEDFLNIEKIEKASNIDFLRNKLFYGLSNLFIEMTTAWHANSQLLYVQHCPMANNDRGAEWLSKEKEILNPYYGASMLRCGEVKWEVVE